jgi:hypothetical protein
MVLGNINLGVDTALFGGSISLVSQAKKITKLISKLFFKYFIFR